MGRDRSDRPRVDDSCHSDEGKARAPGAVVRAHDGDPRSGADARRCSLQSTPAWDALEGRIRGEIQRRLQEVLEEEVTGFLGRCPYERRSGVDTHSGYRNGYAKLRVVTRPSRLYPIR